MEHFIFDNFKQKNNFQYLSVAQNKKNKNKQRICVITKYRWSPKILFRKKNLMNLSIFFEK